MKERKVAVLHISFHNPNTADDTAKHLTKIIADSLAHQAAYGQLGTKSANLMEVSLSVPENRRKAV